MRVAINGGGRIGRAALKILMDSPEFELVAVNDLIPADHLVYLIRYDSVYGPYRHKVAVEGSTLMIGDHRVKLFSEPDPARLPWRDMNVDLVLECTGMFRKEEDLQKHIVAGAKFVILSAPAKSESIGVVVHGVNQADGTSRIISCASCTTNCIAPLVEIMGRRIGIQRAIMTTVHAYTASQQVVDGYDKSFRRGRAAAANMVPTSTGAAKATVRALPELRHRFDGVAIRVPVAIGSIADVTFVTSRATTREEINDIFRQEASGGRYKDVVGVSEDPIVSSDIIGDSRAPIVDLEMTRVVDGRLAKVMSWYDNEWGFTNQMIREARGLLVHQP